MKEYMVSLDIVTTKKISRAKLCNVLGVKKGEFKFKEGDDKYIWTFESRLKDNAPILDHVIDLTSRFAVNPSTSLDSNVKEVFLVIGTLFDTFTCTVPLSNKCIQILLSKVPSANIEIVYYPCEESDN